MATWQDYLEQSRRFWDVVQAVGDPHHTSQAASNAVLAAIAATDAVCLYLVGEQPRGEAHSTAPTFLQRACKGTPWEAEAAARARQLADILQQKNAAQYHGKALNQTVAERTIKQTERYLRWVEAVLPVTNAD